MPSGSRDQPGVFECRGGLRGGAFGDTQSAGDLGAGEGPEPSEQQLGITGTRRTVGAGETRLAEVPACIAKVMLALAIVTHSNRRDEVCPISDHCALTRWHDLLWTGAIAAHVFAEICFYGEMMGANQVR